MTADTPARHPAWQPLGGVPPARLADARLQLHWAAQAVASVGAVYLEPRADDSHPNMEWVSAEAALVGHPTDTDPAVRAAVEPATLALSLRDRRGAVLDRLPLDGQTLPRALAWLGAAVTRATGGAATTPLRADRYDIPRHDVAEGAPFAFDAPDAFAEVGRWFANADLALGAAAAGLSASPVRCWPHHFDLGAVITLDPDRDPESARSIGIGMTPGDESYPEPYYYVNPWPRPKAPSPAPLGGGAHWHDEGWYGAVLRGEVLARVAADEQPAVTRAYLAEAIDATRRMLLGDD